MRLLLDTSVFLWYLTADPRLHPAVADAVRSPENEVWLSVVSVWEILVKHRLGRLPLPEEPSTYVPKQREQHRIASLPLVEEALVHLPRMPLLHRDPFDRILVCQALEHELLLVTSHENVRAYPVKTYWG